MGTVKGNQIKTEPGVPVEEVTPTPVQFKNTTHGKTIRTFYQAFPGVVVVALTALTLNEQFRDYMMAHPEWGWLGVLLPVLIAVATYIQNKLDPTVPDTVSDKV